MTSWSRRDASIVDQDVDLAELPNDRFEDRLKFCFFVRNVEREPPAACPPLAVISPTTLVPASPGCAAAAATRAAPDFARPQARKPARSLVDAPRH